MGAQDLSVQVLNISPRTTKEDVITLFSYCGTVDDTQLQRDGDESQSAVLTFRQPYAFKTALLLNDAILADRRIRVLPLENWSVPITIRSSVKKQIEGLPAAQPAANRKHEVLNKVTDRVSDAAKILLQQSNTAISAAEQTVSSIGTTISNSSYFAKGTRWLSGMLDSTSKSRVQLGNAKARNPNSRKQK